VVRVHVRLQLRQVAQHPPPPLLQRQPHVPRRGGLDVRPQRLLPAVLPDEDHGVLPPHPPALGVGVVLLPGRPGHLLLELPQLAPRRRLPPPLAPAPGPHAPPPHP